MNFIDFFTGYFCKSLNSANYFSLIGILVKKDNLAGKKQIKLQNFGILQKKCPVDFKNLPQFYHFNRFTSK